MAQFEMIYYKKVKNNSSILAEFGVKIVPWQLSLYKLKLIQTKGGGTFIKGPWEEYKDAKTGEKKYAKYWAFDRDKDESFQKEIKRFVEDHIATLPQEEVKAVQEDELPF